MLFLTKEQRKSVRKLHQRQQSPGPYRAFRKNNVHACFDRSGAVMVHCFGIWIGIERDGHAHS